MDRCVCVCIYIYIYIYIYTDVSKLENINIFKNIIEQVEEGEYDVECKL